MEHQKPQKNGVYWLFHKVYTNNLSSINLHEIFLLYLRAVSSIVVTTPRSEGLKFDGGALTLVLKTTERLMLSFPLYSALSKP